MSREAGMDFDGALSRAKEVARQTASSSAFVEFSRGILKRFPGRGRLPQVDLDRDCFRIVDHHLSHLIPCMRSYMEFDTRLVLDFGCGSGGSAVALALVYPELRCHGTDIDAEEIAVARERAALYKVADRCEFHHVAPNKSLPFPPGFFDLCLCSSVLEYVIERDVRKFCVQEMVRLLAHRGSLVVSGPNGLYPFEVHSWWQGKPNWGWNYFPGLFNAHIVDCTAWEVKKCARPTVLKLHRTPLLELLKPWSTFCLKRASSDPSQH